MECRIKDTPVYYEEFGEGKPMLMLHGTPLDHRSMQIDMEPLFQGRTGWRRIYPDLPGMGKTPGSGSITNQDQVLELVMEFIDRVMPGERFAAAGTSYGGFLVRGLLHELGNRMDGVLMNVPSILADAKKTNSPQFAVIQEDQAFLQALTPEEQGIKDMVVKQSLEVLEDFRMAILPAVAIADHNFLKCLEQLPNYAFSFDVDKLPEPFPAPVLIITGKQDHWCGYKDAFNILDNYPRAAFVVLDSAGHALSFEQKPLFRALACEWLDRVEAYTENQNR